MKHITSAITIFLSVILLQNVFAFFPSERIEKFNQVQHQREERRVELTEATIQETRLTERATATRPQYLNPKSKRFAVDGKSLENVTFDIGESYAGLLPIDNTGKELFFWFVPTTNPKAKDEIVIWLKYVLLLCKFTFEPPDMLLSS